MDPNRSAMRTGRWAIAALFFLNGFVIGSWAPQIPEFLTRLRISETTLGLLILLFGLGAITFMPLSGYLMSRMGSRTVLRGFSIVTVFGLLIVALAPNVPLAAVAMFLFGGLIGGMDVAMNANAVTVERRMARAIMSSSHGFWSLGGFFGGGLGGVAIQIYGHLLHAVAVTAVAIVVLVVAYRHVVAEDTPPHAATHKRGGLPRSLTIYVIGLVALSCMVPEGAILDWAALYLKQELGAEIATAGLAYSFFAGAMALMRFLGDGFRNRFGAVNTFRISGVIAGAGVLVASVSPWPWLIIAAFAFAGLGIANMVPIAYSAGGNQPGMATSTGMSVVTTMGYSGILLAPSAIGFVAERTGFAPVFFAMAIMLFATSLSAPLVRTADCDHG